MIFLRKSRGRPAKEVYEILRSFDYEPTGKITDTGEIWSNKKTGHPVSVPRPINGHYPDWLFDRLRKSIEESIGVEKKNGRH